MTSKKLTEVGTKNVLMPRLLKLKELDKQVEQKRKTWGWVWGLSLFIAFISIFLIAPFPPMAILTVLAGITFVIGLIIYIAEVKKDMDNRKLDLAINLVQVVQEDIPPDTNISLFIDFGAYNKNGKLLSKEGGLMSSIKTLNYEHPWFKCAGVLYDGNKFELDITQYVDRREKSKRKYTKVKEKIVEKATLNLKLNPRVYPSPETVAEQVFTGQLPHGISVSRCLGKNRVLKVTAVTPPAVLVHARSGPAGSEENLFNGDKLLGLFIDAYSGLQKARPTQAAQQA